MKPQRIKGISFIDGLQILFIAFQLAHIIDWSWFLVMSPLIFKFVCTWAINAIEERNRTKGR